MTTHLETSVEQYGVAPKHETELVVRVRPCQMAGAGCMVAPVPVHEPQKDYSGLGGPIGRRDNIRPKQRLIAVWRTRRSGYCESREFLGQAPADHLLKSHLRCSPVRIGNN